VQGAAEHRLLDALREACRAHGLLKARGRQRTDATPVRGTLRVLARLERVAQTLRAALHALAQEAPAWLQERVPPDWYARAGRRLEAYRLPVRQADREADARPVGADGGWLGCGPTRARSRRPHRRYPLGEVVLLPRLGQQAYALHAQGG